MESGSAGEDYGERVAAELARLRETLDDLRRRPIPPDADTLRHVVTASLSEANAPPPNLLVTAIRRLDRVDARLESIETALGAPASLPRGGAVQASGAGRGRAPAVAPPTPLPSPPAPDAEAIAEALARRLAGLMSAPSALSAGGQRATIEDLVDALRPRVPEAARTVLRRAGREPSPQAVEVLQQTAMTAIEEAAESIRPAFGHPEGSFGPSTGAGSDLWASPEPSRLAPPSAPQALGPAPAPTPTPAPTPAPPPIDIESLASSIAARVTDALAAQPQQAPPPEEPVRPPARQEPPPPPPIDPKVVADAVISRLAEQPPPQAVVSPMAMAPLLSAVGNVEAAVARLAEPEADVVVAVDRLEAGVDALARALEDDRSVQVDEVRRGFAELNEVVRLELAAPRRGHPGEDEPGWAASSDVEAAPLDLDLDVEDEGAGPAGARVAVAVVGVQRRLDRLSGQLEPLDQATLEALPALATQADRLERSLNHILTALAALAEHLHEQSSAWQGRFDELGALVTSPHAASEGAGRAPTPLDVAELATRVDELVAGLAADGRRFQRLGGTIDGLAELLGEVSERLDRLPRDLEERAGDAVEDRPRAPRAAEGAGDGDHLEITPAAVGLVPELDDEPSATSVASVTSAWDSADDEAVTPDSDDPCVRQGDHAGDPPAAVAPPATDEPGLVAEAQTEAAPPDADGHAEPPDDDADADADADDPGATADRPRRRRRSRRGGRRG